MRRGAVTVRPAVERFAGDRVRFTDATDEEFVAIIYATGYQLSLPFLAPGLVSVNGREVALYRRIVPPGVPAGLFFAGCVDAPGGLLPLAETQADWIAAVLGGRLVLSHDRADVARDRACRTPHRPALPRRDALEHPLRSARLP